MKTIKRLMQAMAIATVFIAGNVFAQAAVLERIHMNLQESSVFVPASVQLVCSDEGIVTLTGSADSLTFLKRLEEVISSTEGVTEVISNVTESSS